jgi:hypothetical protein
MPRSGTAASIPDTEFSTERALIPLREISKAPHYHGSKEHERVRSFLKNELNDLGMETEIQEGFVLNSESRSLNKPKNIIGRIKGTGNGKALLLLSHYDSSLVPSFGASDAGSGIVTILESLRAYKASGKTPKNDIIVVFTDCEEIGLDGAKLFVNKHPWAKDIGFVMNFEARGSGGPSVMILESNGGNASLIEAFIEANPKYPVASSLMYSVYKILPNSTDSTVFREDGDIDSFFFAFIDDHFDYHTANDTVENLDINSLQHNGSYLMPLLDYFANTDLDSLKAKEDKVYVNLPLIKMISYPFSWILPMALTAGIVLVVLIFYGIKKHKLSGKGIAQGFVPLLVSLVLCGLIGYFGWLLLLKIYPQYNEVQHGFKYNGHSYVGFFVFLSLAILFKLYAKLSKDAKVANLFIAPLILWMLINSAVYIYLKGAGYFIIPVFFGLISLWVLLRQDKPNLLLMALLAAPAIFLYEQLIRFFPVALGSDHVFISSVFTVLLFGLLLPVFGFYRRKRLLAFCCSVVAVIFLINAHTKSGFSETRQKPNSLVYYQNANTNKAYWVTYDAILDDWTRGYLGDAPDGASKYVESAAGSKYNVGYTYASEAPPKGIPQFKTVIESDTVVDNYRNVTFTIHPQRIVNQISLYATGETNFTSLVLNGESVPKDSLGNLYDGRKSKKLVRYYVADNDSLEVSYAVPKDAVVSFTVMESSFDLLSNPLFTINKRQKNMMPKPFIVTDAILVSRSIFMDSIPKKVQDTQIQISETNE